jgi:predicted flap endonuclease-1-like 5' DNA nuclease
LTFSIAQLVAVLILGCSSFLSGWMLRRIQAKSREAELIKTLAEAQTTIPSLETNIRNRDQRIAALFGELTEWKAKFPTLEAAAKRKDVEVLAKATELESLRNSLRVAQARCATLTADVAERDARIAQAATAPPAFIALPVAPLTPTESELLARVDALTADLAAREQLAAQLQQRLDAEVEQRSGVSAELLARKADVERFAAEVAKWQARVPKLVATIKARDTSLAAHETTLTEKDALISARDALLADRDAMLAQRDAQIADVSSQLTEAATRLAHAVADGQSLSQAVADRDTTVVALEIRLAALTQEHEAAAAEHAAKLTTSLRLGRDEVERHRAELELARAELDEQAERAAAMQRDLEAADARHAQLAAAAADETLRRDAIDVQLREQHADLAGEVSHLQAQLADAASHSEAMERDHDALQQRLTQTSDERAALAAQLATSLRLGRDEVERHRAELELARAELHQQAERAATMQRDLEAADTRHTQLVSAAAADAAHRQSIDAQLRQQHADLVGQVSHLQAQLADGASRSEAMEQEHRALQQRLAQTSDERTALEARLSQAGAERAQLERRIDAEQHQRAEAAKNLEALRQTLATVQVDLVEADSQRTALEMELDALRRERGANDADALEAERAQRTHAQAQLELQTAALASLREEAAQLHGRIAPLESSLGQRDASLSEHAQRSASLNAQLEAMSAQNESLQDALRQRGERIAELERTIVDQPTQAAPVAAEPAEQIELRLVAQIEKNRELAKSVEERERDLVAAAKTNELNEKSMRVLKQQLDDARATEERLASQVRELKAMAQRAPEGEADAAHITMSKPQGLFELPPERVDELQQIRGIGDGFERGLNKLGIYQFSQLAGLSAQEIAWIEAHLPTFHGRVERDDWPGQAAALMAASEHAEWSLRAQNAPSLSPRIN